MKSLVGYCHCSYEKNFEIERTRLNEELSLLKERKEYIDNLLKILRDRARIHQTSNKPAVGSNQQKKPPLLPGGPAIRPLSTSKVSAIRPLSQGLFGANSPLPTKNVPPASASMAAGAPFAPTQMPLAQALLYTPMQPVFEPSYTLFQSPIVLPMQSAPFIFPGAPASNMALGGAQAAAGLPPFTAAAANGQNTFQSYEMAGVPPVPGEVLITGTKRLKLFGDGDGSTSMSRNSLLKSFNADRLPNSGSFVGFGMNGAAAVEFEPLENLVVFNYGHFKVDPKLAVERAAERDRQFVVWDYEHGRNMPTRFRSPDEREHQQSMSPEKTILSPSNLSSSQFAERSRNGSSVANPNASSWFSSPPRQAVVPSVDADTLTSPFDRTKSGSGTSLAAARNGLAAGDGDGDAFLDPRDLQRSEVQVVRTHQPLPEAFASASRRSAAAAAQPQRGSLGLLDTSRDDNSPLVRDIIARSLVTKPSLIP